MNDYPLDLIINQLKTYDETELCDMLHITSEDILRRFEDKVRQRRKYLEKELEVFPDSDSLDDDKEIDHGYQELNFEE